MGAGTNAQQEDIEDSIPEATTAEQSGSVPSLPLPSHLLDAHPSPPSLLPTVYRRHTLTSFSLSTTFVFGIADFMVQSKTGEHSLQRRRQRRRRRRQRQA